MADKWEYRTAEAGTFKLDRLLAQGWEAYTATEQPDPDDTPRRPHPCGLGGDDHPPAPEFHYST